MQSFSLGILTTTETVNHYRKWGLESQHLAHAVNLYEFDSEAERDAFAQGFEIGMGPRSTHVASQHDDEAEKRSYEKGIVEGIGQEAFWLLSSEDLQVFLDDVGLS